MKKSLIYMTALGLAMVGMNANANLAAQEDAATVHAQTVSKKAANYTCQSGKKIKVTYGFNKQGLPTYAQANLNGKSRFMPINLNRSGDNNTVFGDENNFSLTAHTELNSRNYRKTNFMIFSPSSEILYKDCHTGKR